MFEVFGMLPHRSDIGPRDRLAVVESQVRRLRLAMAALVILNIYQITFAQVGPNHELGLAAKDTAALPERMRGDVRYLTLYNIPSEERAEMAAVVSFVLNSVSRADIIIQPVRISETLLRFQITQVAPRAKGQVEWLAAWEAMASEDPYFHIRTKAAVPLAKGSKGEAVIEEAFTDGGWIDLQAAAYMRKATRSAGAILRADYFVARAVLPPAYYSLAGVPTTEAAFHEQRLGLDHAAAVRLRGVQGANLFRSAVTDKPRRLSRWPTASGGSVWITEDVAKPTAASDTFREPRSQQFQYDASEQIGSMPNGLHIYALYSQQGNRVDFVPPNIALDFSAMTPIPVQLAPMLSCVRCHSVENGLLSFRDEQARLLAGRVRLLSSDPETAQQLASFYGRQKRLARYVDRDREDYAESVALAAIDMDVSATGKALNKAYLRYVRADVTAAVACLELGIPLKVDDKGGIAPAASIQLGKGIIGTTDPILLALIEDIAVQRSQFEFSFAEAALLASPKGAKPGKREPTPARGNSPVSSKPLPNKK